MNLSSRGSSDILVTVLVLGTVYFLKKKRIFLAGVLYGTVVHFKIYPIVYCLLFYMFLKENQSFINRKSITFGVISGGVFLVLTGVFYAKYGWEFLYEGYLYHLIRKDHRHNFSIQFLNIYLTFFDFSRVKSILTFLPTFILIGLISVKFRRNLFFALYLISFVFVIFNKVVTAQYFIWFSQFFPLVLLGFKKEKFFRIAVESVIWYGVVLYWNTFAHKFEALG